MRARSTPFASFTDLMAGLLMIFFVALVAARSRTDPAELAQKRAEGAKSGLAHALTCDADDCRGGADPSALWEPEIEIGSACRKEEVELETLGPGYVRLAFSKEMFDSGSTQPRADAEACLRRVGYLLRRILGSEGGSARSPEPVKDSPCLEISVIAHADATPVRLAKTTSKPARQRLPVGPGAPPPIPCYEDNLELSALRAVRVEGVLREGPLPPAPEPDPTELTPSEDAPSEDAPDAGSRGPAPRADPGKLDPDTTTGADARTGSLAPEQDPVWFKSVSISGMGARQPMDNLEPNDARNRRVWIDLYWRWGAKNCGQAPLLFGAQDGSQ